MSLKPDNRKTLPLDDRTAEWLEEVALEAGSDPATIAASILRDVRQEDEQAHATLH